jgi:hypothetical protein
LITLLWPGSAAKMFSSVVLPQLSPSQATEALSAQVLGLSIFK